MRQRWRSNVQIRGRLDPPNRLFVFTESDWDGADRTERREAWIRARAEWQKVNDWPGGLEARLYGQREPRPGEQWTRPPRTHAEAYLRARDAAQAPRKADR